MCCALRVRIIGFILGDYPEAFACLGIKSFGQALAGFIVNLKEKVMRKLISAIVVLALIGIVIWAIVGREKQKSESENPIKIGVIVYPDLGPFYVAQEKEFFEKQGVNAEVVMLSLENMIPSLESGEVQMLAITGDMVPIIADSGIDAKEIFATSSSYGADGIVVTKNINSIRDLKSKDVYLYYGFPSHFIFRYLMEKNGIARDNINLVNMNTEEVGSSFVAGKIDAGVTWEPWLTNARERSDGKVLWTSKEDPDIMVDTFVAKGDLIANRRNDIEKVMRAYFSAADWWMNNRSEGDEIIARNFNLTTDEFSPMVDTIKLTDYNKNLELFDQSQPNNLYELARKAAGYYLGDGVVTKEVDIDSFIDNSLVKELYR
jgi:NitT/TauT family transport system substrate-binding protein